MSAASETDRLLSAFVDELSRCGLRHACTSPGSRCAPLVLALAREPRLRCHSHVDERCAAFFALGAAKASNRPVAVACTSGTAVAELLPAVVEAHEARVPLIVLSADRPPELREIGAAQTIDQLGIFGRFAKWFFEVGVLDVGKGAAARTERWLRMLACRAYWRALDGRPGVVHLNFALREPLVSVAPPAPPPTGGRPDGRPLVTRPPARLVVEEDADSLAEALASARRVVVVAGRHERETPLGQAAAELCERAGWPLLADPLSGARRGRAAIAHYDALLRAPALACASRDATAPADATRADAARATTTPASAAPARPDLAERLRPDLAERLRPDLAERLRPDLAERLRPDLAERLRPDLAERLRPDLVLRVGELPTSKPLRAWLAAMPEVPQAVIDCEGVWQDPDATVCRCFALEPAAALAALDPPRADPGWLAGWRDADERAAQAIRSTLAAEGALSEPLVAAELGALLPQRATVFVASSMPVRDIESFWPVRPDPPRVLCNRGANGIDGTVSSAFGAAAAGDRTGGDPVVLLIGDVALAHDLGGLIAARRLGLKLTIVLIDNGGGAIFDFLPVSKAPLALQEDRYEQHIATPTGLDFAQAAALYGLEHERVPTPPALRSTLERAIARERSTLIEVRGERGANAELHARTWAAVADALKN